MAQERLFAPLRHAFSSHFNKDMGQRHVFLLTVREMTAQGGGETTSDVSSCAMEEQSVAGILGMRRFGRKEAADLSRC